MTTSDTNTKEKNKIIPNRTNGRKMTGLLLSHSHSCIIHTNLS